EVLVGFINGATDYRERDQFTEMGLDGIALCGALHMWIERSGAVPSGEVSSEYYAVVGAQTYDERLRAFAGQQRDLILRARTLSEDESLDGELRATLATLGDSHQRRADWCELRADEFAVTRALVYKGGGQGWVQEEVTTAIARETPRAPAPIADGAEADSVPTAPAAEPPGEAVNVAIIAAQPAPEAAAEEPASEPPLSLTYADAPDAEPPRAEVPVAPTLADTLDVTPGAALPETSAPLTQADAPVGHADSPEPTTPAAPAPPRARVRRVSRPAGPATTRRPRVTKLAAAKKSAPVSSEEPPQE
ncbi:MAG TPA: hypothetical protein VF807_15620, partial [Ktedonobacterales bacterium]